MTRGLILFCLILLRLNLGFGQVNKYYIAHKSFGGINNRIELSKLDSLISKIPYKRLGNDSAYNDSINTAISILNEKLKRDRLIPINFFITEIIKQNDSTISFRLEHLDSFVYYYNLDKENKKLASKPLKNGYVLIIPPTTGNISGYEGLYKVDIKSQEIEVYYDE